MPKFLHAFLGILVLGSWLGSAPAHAQYTYDFEFGSMMMQQTFQGINHYNQTGDLIRETQARDARNGIFYPANEHLRKNSGRRSSAGKRSQSPAAAALNTRVDYDPAVSAEAKRSYLGGIRKRFGDRIADAFTAEFDRQDVRSAFTQLTAPYGLRVNAYEDVFAGYMLTMWVVANQADLPNTGQVQGMVRQVRTVFEAKGLSSNRRERQLTAEGMLYEMVSVLYARQEAQRVGDQATLQKMADTVQSRFVQSNHLDLQAMALTGDGMTKR